MDIFCLQKSDSCSREQLAIITASRSLGYGYCFGDVCPGGLIPIGDVPYCEAAFGRQPEIKNFFPRFLSGFINRDIACWDGCRSVSQRCFAKIATEWKSDFQSRVVEAGAFLPHGLYLLSGVVEFSNEFRYYVANGEVITSAWYQGDDEDMLPPKIPVQWPRGFSGAIDFGLIDGEIALVEAHAPFACGWYGDDPELFAMWQIEAWAHSEFWTVR